jgi:TetR/AcrR family transcriptional regulator, cholesterol catabolism regulator
MPGSPAERKKRAIAPQGRREEILDVAARLCAKHGYHKASMDSIAAAVGINKASLYHHFESKEAIVVAIHQSMTDRLFELNTLRTDSGGGTSPKRQLFGVVQDIVSLAESHPGQLRILFDHYRELPEAMQVQVSNTRKAYRKIISQILKQGVASGEFGDIDIDFAARAVVGLCDWVTESYRPSGALGPRALAERTWKLLVIGLGSAETKRQLTS